jgi:hypothetical protein
MKIKTAIAFLTLISSFNSWAFTCYYTLAKDNCWKTYDVTVDVSDGATGAILTSVTIPKGELWVRKAFSCQPSQTLVYSARYEPIFWAQDKGKTYPSLRSWPLPQVINPGDSAWNISVCYPSAFASVPMPPQATNNCQCDFDSIPVIPPKQLPPS